MALRSDLTTGGPMVMFGTKWPSITSTCSNVPPASNAALASAASCAKFADNIDGANSILDNSALLQPYSKDYTQLYQAIVQRVLLLSWAISNTRMTPKAYSGVTAIVARPRSASRTLA